MIGARASVTLATLYCGPILVWAGGALAAWGSVDAIEIARQTGRILLVVQAVVAAIAAPWYAQDASLPDSIVALFILMLVPLPIIAVVWSMGGMSAAQGVAGQIAVTALALAILLAAATAARLAPGVPVRTASTAVLQVAALAIVVGFHREALALLGL
jgi:hypothetical protein